MMNRLMIASCLGGALLLAACDDNPGTDAGPMGVDAGDPGMDSGEAMMDAGPPALDCTLPAGDDLWTPPDGLPAFTAADRGRVLKCGTTDPIDAATVDARARAPFALTADDPGTYDGPTLTEGATRTLVLYRSERRNGEGGVSSGTLYLPSSGATDLPPRPRLGDDRPRRRLRPFARPPRISSAPCTCSSAPATRCSCPTSSASARPARSPTSSRPRPRTRPSTAPAPRCP